MLHDVLSVKYPGCDLKRGGFVQSHLLCPSARLQPVSQQLGMGCGFIHLNTTAAFKVELERAKRESDLTVPNPSCVPVSDVVRKPLHFLLLLALCWFVTALFSFLHEAFLCKMRVLVIQLNSDAILAKTWDAF